MLCHIPAYVLDIKAEMLFGLRRGSWYGGGRRRRRGLRLRGHGRRWRRCWRGRLGKAQVYVLTRKAGGREQQGYNGKCDAGDHTRPPLMYVHRRLYGSFLLCLRLGLTLSNRLF